MNGTTNKLLTIEYFDKSDSNYRQRLTIHLSPNQLPNPFVVAQDAMLHALDTSNDWHYIPLGGVKEYVIHKEETVEVKHG